MTTIIERAEEVKPADKFVREEMEMRRETVKRKCNIVVAVVAQPQPLRSRLPLPAAMVIVFVPVLQSFFILLV